MTGMDVRQELHRLGGVADRATLVAQTSRAEVDRALRPGEVVRRIVLEADSFAWHGDRSALRWDARRYDNLVVRGWLVLRFAWEDVMHDQDYVRHTLQAISALVHEQAEVREAMIRDA
jgi:Protein of unknown function (DUF559)